MAVRHLNQTDLAARWNLSPRTLERWRWLGQGPKFLKLGGRILYRLEDIEAFEEQQLLQVTGSAAAALAGAGGPAATGRPPARRGGSAR
jgi:hypothetical protein